MKYGRCLMRDLSECGIYICQRVRQLFIMELLICTRSCLQMESIMICRLLDGIKKKAAYNRLVDIHQPIICWRIKIVSNE